MKSSRLVGRRGALWSGLLALGVMVSLTAIAEPAAACVCAKRTLCEKTQAADVVFEATPVDRTAQGGTVTYEVSVGKVYKGLVTPDTVVQSKASSSSCGVDLHLGTPYIVFGMSVSPGTVATTSCSGTAPAAVFAPADIDQITHCAAAHRDSTARARLALKAPCARKARPGR